MKTIPHFEYAKRLVPQDVLEELADPNPQFSDGLISRYSGEGCEPAQFNKISVFTQSDVTAD